MSAECFAKNTAETAEPSSSSSSMSTDDYHISAATENAADAQPPASVISTFCNHTDAEVAELISEDSAASSTSLCSSSSSVFIDSLQEWNEQKRRQRQLLESSSSSSSSSSSTSFAPALSATLGMKSVVSAANGTEKVKCLIETPVADQQLGAQSIATANPFAAVAADLLDVSSSSNSSNTSNASVTNSNSVAPVKPKRLSGELYSGNEDDGGSDGDDSPTRPVSRCRHDGPSPPKRCAQEFSCTEAVTGTGTGAIRSPSFIGNAEDDNANDAGAAADAAVAAIAPQSPPTFDDASPKSSTQEAGDEVQLLSAVIVEETCPNRIDLRMMDAIERHDVEEEHRLSGNGRLIRCANTRRRQQDQDGDELEERLPMDVINTFRRSARSANQSEASLLAASSPTNPSDLPVNVAAAPVKVAVTTPSNSRTKTARSGVPHKTVASARLNLSDTLEKVSIKDTPAPFFRCYTAVTSNGKGDVDHESAKPMLPACSSRETPPVTCTFRAQSSQSQSTSCHTSASTSSSKTSAGSLSRRSGQSNIVPHKLSGGSPERNLNTNHANENGTNDDGGDEQGDDRESAEQLGNREDDTHCKPNDDYEEDDGNDDAEDDQEADDEGGDDDDNEEDEDEDEADEGDDEEEDEDDDQQQHQLNVDPHDCHQMCTHGHEPGAAEGQDIVDQGPNDDDDDDDQQNGAGEDDGNDNESVGGEQSENGDDEGEGGFQLDDEDDEAVQEEDVGAEDAVHLNADQDEVNGEAWTDCVEALDPDEICTCIDYSEEEESTDEADEEADEEAAASGRTVADDQSGVEDDGTGSWQSTTANSTPRKNSFRKRRLNDWSASSPTGSVFGSAGGCDDGGGGSDMDVTVTPTNNKRKRLLTSDSIGTPTSSAAALQPPRTPRSLLIPTRDHPPPELGPWLLQFQRWTNAERMVATDRLIDVCEPTQVRHMMKVIEPQFQRDFISLLPKELALGVLSFLEPEDLLRAAQTCRTWRFLCDDNLLWRDKCRTANICNEQNPARPRRGRTGSMPSISSPWKAAYMRQTIIEMNWRSRPIREAKTLKGHDDHVITCLQFCGNRIVSGSDDNTLKVWSAITGKCLRTLVGHTGGVWSSQMAGDTIISGSTDRSLKVWNVETGMCLHTLFGHTSTVRCMHLHGNKVVSGSRDATLRVWDIVEGKCLHILVGHLAAVRCVQYDGKLVVSGAYDYMVKVWHPERQECLHTLQGHTNRVYSLQFDGVHVVSGSLDTSIRVWDAETGNCRHTLMGHQSLTSGMELRQNILVSGNADSTVKVWDITTGQCLQTLSGAFKHQSAVTCLQFNSRFVVTSSDDGTVKLWDVRTGSFIRNLVLLDSGGSGGVVWRIRANDTKLICAVGSRNGTEETKLMVLDFDVEGACLKCS